MSHELHLSLKVGVVLRLSTKARRIEVTVFTHKHFDVHVPIHATVDINTLRVVGDKQLCVDSFAGFLEVTSAEAAVLTAFLAMCKEGA